jgi:hypothetical protein
VVGGCPLWYAAILCPKYASRIAATAMLMRGQNSLKADQSSHPLFYMARVDVFGHERAINFTHDARRSNVGRR